MSFIKENDNNLIYTFITNKNIKTQIKSFDNLQIIKYPNIDSSVEDKDFVYLNIDGKYYKAIADGTEKQNVIGMYSADDNIIVTSGITTIGISSNYGQAIYLSDTNPGKPQITETNIKLGTSLGGNYILLNQLNGSNINLNDESIVTFESLEYMLLLQNNSFNEVYYDIFRKSGTINIVQGIATYNKKDNKYIISNTSAESCIIETNDIINDGSTYYRFLIHLNSTTIPTVEYSIDQGNTWENCELDHVISIYNGYTTLRLRFIFTEDGDFNSYGVYYKEEYGYDDEGQHIFIDLTTGIRYKLVVDNGRLILASTNYNVNIYSRFDYEHDGQGHHIFTDLTTGTKYRLVVNNGNIELIDFTGNNTNVDPSTDIRSIMDYEHDGQGHHIFTDLTTGTKYRLAINNGSIILIDFTGNNTSIDPSANISSIMDYEHNEQGQHVFTDLTTGTKYRLAINNGNIILVSQ